MSADRADPYALDDGGLVRRWLTLHPAPETQEPLIAFLADLCQTASARDDRSTSIWAPVEGGFEEIPLAWVIDHTRRLVRIGRVGPLRRR